MFTAALFTIVKTWKQPKCPSTGVDQEDAIHIHNGKLLSQFFSISSAMFVFAHPHIHPFGREHPA